MDLSNISWTMDFNGVAIRGAPPWAYENQEETISVMETNTRLQMVKAGVGMAWAQVVAIEKKKRNLHIWKIINGMGFLVLKTILMNISVWSYMGKTDNPQLQILVKMQQISF